MGHAVAGQEQARGTDQPALLHRSRRRPKGRLQGVLGVCLEACQGLQAGTAYDSQPLRNQFTIHEISLYRIFISACLLMPIST